jgi:copper(I)-binding protein
MRRAPINTEAAITRKACRTWTFFYPLPLESLMKIKVLTAILLLGSSAVFAQTVEVTDAWVRSTVAGQKGTGAFMSITAKDGARLVGVSSPVAGVAEVHEMKMEGDIMKMRAVPVLDLPAGQTVQLKPGGYHIMMMDLKQPLPRDSKVPLTLRLLDSRGTESRIELSLPVSTVAPGKNDSKNVEKTDQHGAHKH